MSNPRSDRVRDVAKLAGRPVRLKRGQFLAEGPQAVREALLADRAAVSAGERRVVAQVYATSVCLDRFPELSHLTGGVDARMASDEVLAAMGDTVKSQGIIAVCNMVDVGLEQVLSNKPTLLAVFSRMRDPGNAGTVLRAADAAGADAVVVTHSSVDIYNPKTVRSTAGSLFHLPVVIGQDFGLLASRLCQAGITLLAADGHGDTDLDSLQDRSAQRRIVSSVAGSQERQGSMLEAPTAWVFGNEAQGLTADELAMTDHRVAVPVYGSAESLNLATAAAICLYASARAQRP